MRLGESLIASAGRVLAPVKSTPRSAADFCTTAAEAAGMKNVPAGYVFPPSDADERSQYTSPFDLKTRLITVNASFSSCDMKYPAAFAAFAIVPAGGLASS